MIFSCDDCKYVDECKPHKENPQSIGCSDFGLFDEDGLIDDVKDLEEAHNDSLWWSNH